MELVQPDHKDQLDHQVHQDLDSVHPDHRVLQVYQEVLVLKERLVSQAHRVVWDFLVLLVVLDRKEIEDHLVVPVALVL